jgi:hypothetical protein
MAEKKTSTEQRLPHERAAFRSLLLVNPNHFGNLPDIGFKPAIEWGSNDSYEQIVCVGFHPDVDRLDAVVHIRQSTGYGGELCMGGSTEYVRFYLSFDEGATWSDQGLASFPAHDIAAKQSLEYEVAVTASAQRWLCVSEHIALARAILSWNVAPPANMPGFRPVWGNVAETHVQIAPRRRFSVGDFFDQIDLELDPEIATLIDMKQTIVTAEELPANTAELLEPYRKHKVPDHRTLGAHLEQIVGSQPGLAELSGIEVGYPTTLEPFGEGPPSGPTGPYTLEFTLPVDLEQIDIGQVVGDFLDTSGDTTYEQLACVGLNPTQNMLAATLTIKKTKGYSGNLCEIGSLEYVAFWVDWNDGAGWTYAGTSAVRVHDIDKLPKKGLSYSVFQPIDLSKHRRPCEAGPKTARVRAVLSWQVPPPANNPLWDPRWGNHAETLVHIMPGPENPNGEMKPYIESVSGVFVCDITRSTGLAVGEKPFGHVVTICGHITSPPDIGASPVKYKVSVREVPPFPGVPGQYQDLGNTFSITGWVQDGTPHPVGYAMDQTIDAFGFYTYREDLNVAGGWRTVTGRVLAKWITAIPMTGMWEIKVEAKDPVTNAIIPAGEFECLPDGTTHSTVRVRLDEIPPTADIAITGFTRGGGALQPAADCGQFEVGDVIHGTYSSFDEHFGGLTLGVKPTTPAHGATVIPSARTYPVVVTGGESGTWSLDTTGMDACGYVVEIRANDRTIVSGNGSGWQNENDVGFCLE